MGGTGSCFKLPQPEPTQIKESDEYVSQSGSSQETEYTSHFNRQNLI